jgi:hypothetical protein
MEADSTPSIRGIDQCYISPAHQRVRLLFVLLPLFKIVHVPLPARVEIVFLAELRARFAGAVPTFQMAFAQERKFPKGLAIKTILGRLDHACSRYPLQVPL